MTAVMKRTKPKLLLAIALVAFIAEEIWSFVARRDQPEIILPRQNQA